MKNEILKLLENNAKLTDKEISKFLNAGEEKIKELRTELEEDGVIVKYSAIINTEKTEQKNIEALIEVKVAPQKLKGFDFYAEQLYNFNEVKSLYLMSGGFDLAVFVSGKDIKDISSFVAEKLSVIDGIVSVATHFILRKYKIEGQIAVKEQDKRQILQA